MISTIAIILISSAIVYAINEIKRARINKKDQIRRETISSLVDELSEGVTEIQVNGVHKRLDEHFLVSGIFSYTPSYRLGKGKISHKSRVVISNKYLIILDWDFDNRWRWESIEKFELHSDGFTIYPNNDSMFKFKTSSIAREEMEVITLVGFESVSRGTIGKLPILNKALPIEEYHDN